MLYSIFFAGRTPVTHSAFPRETRLPRHPTRKQGLRSSLGLLRGTTTLNCQHALLAISGKQAIVGNQHHVLCFGLRNQDSVKWVVVRRLSFFPLQAADRTYMPVFYYQRHKACLSTPAYKRVAIHGYRGWILAVFDHDFPHGSAAKVNLIRRVIDPGQNMLGVTCLPCTWTKTAYAYPAEFS